MEFRLATLLSNVVGPGRSAHRVTSDVLPRVDDMQLAQRETTLRRESDRLASEEQSAAARLGGLRDELDRLSSQIDQVAAERAAMTGDRVFTERRGRQLRGEPDRFGRADHETLMRALGVLHAFAPKLADSFAHMSQVAARRHLNELLCELSDPTASPFAQLKNLDMTVLARALTQVKATCGKTSADVVMFAPKATTPQRGAT
jgi:hypothetical protein